MIDFLQDLEKIIMLLTNIILAIYGTVMTIRAKRWKQTANFVANKVVQKDGLFFAAPASIRAYVKKVGENK